MGIGNNLSMVENLEDIRDKRVFCTSSQNSLKEPTLNTTISNGASENNY